MRLALCSHLATHEGERLFAKYPAVPPPALPSRAGRGPQTTSFPRFRTSAGRSAAVMGTGSPPSPSLPDTRLHGSRLAAASGTRPHRQRRDHKCDSTIIDPRSRSSDKTRLRPRWMSPGGQWHAKGGNLVCRLNQQVWRFVKEFTSSGGQFRKAKMTPARTRSRPRPIRIMLAGRSAASRSVRGVSGEGDGVGEALITVAPTVG